MKHRKLTDKEFIIEGLFGSKILLDRSQRKFIQPFLGKDRSIGEAAKILGVKTNTMHYYVKKLVRAELIEPIREQKIKGRNIVFYRAIGNTFIIPFSETEYISLSEMLFELADYDIFIMNVAQALKELTPVWGIRISEEKVEIVPLQSFRDEIEPISLEEHLQTSTGAFWGSAEKFSLSFEDAKALQKDIANLVKKYHRKSKSKGASYFLTLGLTPLYFNEDSS